jgi:Domain of unknown function (DUF4145)
MDGFQLTAVIFQSFAAFAWPIGLIVVAVMFKAKLGDLLPNLRGKYKDVEFFFQRVEAEAKALPAAPQLELQEAEVAEQLDRYTRVARISPQAAMLELRAVLDDRLRSLAEEHGIEKNGRPPSMLGAIKGLESKGIIDSGTVALLRDLRSMGDAAAHTVETFSLSDAIRYKKLVEQALRQLGRPFIGV